MAPAYVSLPTNLGSRETKTLMKKPALTIKTSKTTMPKTTTSSKTKSPPPTTWTPSRSSKTGSRRSQVPLTTGLRRGRHRQLAARPKQRYTTLMSISIVCRQSWGMQVLIRSTTRSPVTHSPPGEPVSESMTRFCRSATGSTSTHTRALCACCCTSTIACRMRTNVSVSTRPSNSCWTSLLIYR